MGSCPAGWLSVAAGLALALEVATSAAAQEVVSVSPAWDGHLQTGAVSELGITLSAARDSIVRLNLNGTDPPVFAEIDVRGGIPTTAWIPVRPNRDGDVSVAVADTATVTRSLFEVPSTERLVAVVASHDAPDIAAVPLPTGARAVSVSSNALPRTPQGYGTMSAVVIDASAVTRLDARQMDALRAYLADCGRIVLRRFPAEAIRTIGLLAGCGGTFLATVKDDGAIAGTVAALMAADSTAPHGDLPFAPPHPAAFGLAAFALLYVALIMGTVILARRWWHFIVSPVAAAALAYFVWTGRPADSHATVWSQANAAATTGRFQAHVRADGMGLGMAHITIPAAATLLSWPKDAVIDVAATHEGYTTTVITFSTRLHSRESLTLKGTFAGIPSGLAPGKTVRFLPSGAGEAFSGLQAEGWLTVLPPGQPAP